SKTRLTLEQAAKSIETAEMRSRQMTRKLKAVEALPSETAELMLATLEAMDQSVPREASGHDHSLGLSP
ncbi:MAG: hypothetical protein ACJ780_13480, partial [Solirubrobacteraceae bacterium]